jgi:hypothetical protein
MNSRRFGIIAFVAGLLLPAVVFAQPAFSNSGDSTAVINQLQKQERIDEFKAKFWSQEPITQQDYYVQEKEDRHLIARISAGRPVSNDELAQALKHVDTDY